MRVMGIDLSTHAIDCVTIPYDSTGAPVWTRYPLTGKDAFDRARSVADAMPGRGSVLYDDVLAVGIEHPAGHHGTGPLLRIQGAVLAQLPALMLVEPFPPAKWRKAVGLAGNASKDDVKVYGAALLTEIGWSEYRQPAQWDFYDAYCIALATRNAITQNEAA